LINEDVIALVLPGEAHPGADHGVLALVAAGMGGHPAGEVASRIALDIVLRLYYEREGFPPDLLRACLKEANDAICAHGRAEPACAGMGTTCTVLALCNGAVYLAHIGDTRAYLLRDGRLHQLSMDHTLVAELVRQGKITQEQARHSSQRNIITAALGMTPAAAPSIWHEGLPLHVQDRLILCSDGLTDFVDDETIRESGTHLPAFDACEALLNRALNAGGSDDISVGVIVIDADPWEMARPHTKRPLLSPRDVP